MSDLLHLQSITISTLQEAINNGLSANSCDGETGDSALHIAVLKNNLVSSIYYITIVGIGQLSCYSCQC